MIGRLDEVVIDCHAPMHLAEFWQHVLGGYIVRQSHEWVALQPPTGIMVSFQLVPEDTNQQTDIYVHDRDADADGIFDEPGAVETFRASVDTAGAPSGAYGN